MKILSEHFHELMTTCFAAKKTLKITSAPGTGKSKQVEAFARAMSEKYKDDGGYGLFVLDMSKANLADLQGYQMPNEEKHVDAYGKEISVIMGQVHLSLLADRLVHRQACLHLQAWRYRARGMGTGRG